MNASYYNHLKFIVLGVLFLSQSTAVFSQAGSGDIAAPALRAEIMEMAQKDQDVQMEIMRKAQAGENVEPSDWARKDSVFLSHLDRAKDILGEYRWPGYELVGADGSQSFFLIVQHADADPAFQKKALNYLKKAYQNKQASGENVAYLTDRVLVAEGRLQRYGTQLEYDDRACPMPGDIEKEEEVDVRRAEMGLKPLDQYIAESISLMGKTELCKNE